MSLWWNKFAVEILSSFSFSFSSSFIIFFLIFFFLLLLFPSFSIHEFLLSFHLLSFFSSEIILQNNMSKSKEISILHNF